MKTVLAALIVMLTAGAATPSLAQYRDGVEIVRDHGRYGHRADLISERRVERIVFRNGFAEIEDVRLRRDRYLVTAVRPNGAVFRVELDAYDGEFLTSERIGWARGYDRRDYDRHRGGNAIEFRLNLGG